MKTFLTINDLQKNRFRVDADAIAKVLRPFGIDLCKQEYLTHITVDENEDKASYTVIIDYKKDVCVLQFQKPLREYWNEYETEIGIKIFPKSAIEMITYKIKKVFDEFRLKNSILISIKTQIAGDFEIGELILSDDEKDAIIKFIHALKDDNAAEIREN
ncbi:MAG: hypothetical protein IKB41_00475 [Clostridia bacterium]|nr:hypothetical protein [Clostridia bacterium]